MSARYANRRDLSEPAIIARLRALGATVTQLDGNGTPDLLVAYRARWYVAEVKTGKGRLRPSQIDWARRQAASCPVLTTPDEAEAWIRTLPPTEQDVSSAWEAVHEHGQGLCREASEGKQ